MTEGTYAIDTSTPAVVLKFDPNVMHHGGLGVIRSLGRIGVPVYGVHEGLSAPAASSRYLAGRFFWQPSPEDTDRVLTGLLRLAEHIGRPSVLLTTDDAGAIFLAEHGRDLRDRFLFPVLPGICPGSWQASLPARALPRTRRAEPAYHQAGLAGGGAGVRLAAGYPLIAKLTTPWAEGSALRSTSVLASREDLDHAYHTCARSGAGLMLQQFIPGGPGHDWFFHGYCDATSICRPAFTGVKERSYPATAGLTSLGRSAANEELREQVITLLAKLAYRGILDLDIRLDERTGEYHLLDFNPRLGAQFRLFRDTAGTDVALAAYLDLTGQPIPPGEQVNGRAFLVENYDPISALSHLRHRDLTPRAWLASLRTVDETAWFARDDLRPFGLMCLRMGWRLASRPLRAAGDTPPRPASATGPAGRRRREHAVPPQETPGQERPLSQKEEMPL